MRAKLVLEVSPSELGTEYELQIWDADRESAVRPFYILAWRTTDSCKVDDYTLLSHARHVAYVAYSRIGAELSESNRHRPIGLGAAGDGIPR